MKKLCLFPVFAVLFAFHFYCDDPGIPGLPGDSPGENQKYSISGSVKHEGSPLEITVRLESNDAASQQVTTDESGNYSFENIEQGYYTVKPVSEKYTFSPFIKTVTIKDSDEADVSFSAMPVQAGESIRLVFIGDINLNSKVQKTVQEKANGDFIFPFQYIGNYLKGFDLTFGNLESIISDKGEATKTIAGISFEALPDAVNGLLYAGFDVVSVANNHAGDYGEDGMTDCFDRLEAAGIDYAGGGFNYNDAHSPVIKTVKGMKIAYLAYTNVPMFMDSCWLGIRSTSRWIATSKRPGIAWAHESRFDNYGSISEMKRDIAAAAGQADMVIVSVHFGWEYTYEPDDSQKNLAHAAIDSGASLVIGHHPHVIQPVEEYHGGFIAYSLGNFIFDLSEEKAEGVTRGMIVEATVTDRELKDVEIRYSRINEFYQAVPEW